MLPITIYLQLLVSCLFVFIVLFVKTHWKRDSRIVESRCEEFLNGLEIPVPAVLIDYELLTSMESEKCQVEKKIKIGVHINYTLDHINWPSTVDVVYYTSSATKDYLEFQKDRIQLIPKTFDYRMIGDLQVPLDAHKISEFFKRSNYVRCANRTMIRKEYNQSISSKDAVDTLALLRDELIQFGMFPFLTDGTLLGWYRECSVIPHTLDMDISVFSWNYNVQFAKTISSSRFEIVRKLGMLNDSYELTLLPRATAGMPIDIFLMYNTTDGELYTGGMDSEGNRVKFTYSSYDPWCATDLHGHLFWVSCTPEDKMKASYGDEWYLDHPTDRYGWNSSPMNVVDYGNWTEEQMKYIHDPLICDLVITHFY